MFSDLETLMSTVGIQERVGTWFVWTSFCFSDAFFFELLKPTQFILNMLSVGMGQPLSSPFLRYRN